MHQRILSLGEDPLTNKSKGALTLAQMAADMYNMSGYQASLPVYNNQAFSFSVKRSTFSHDTGNYILKKSKFKTSSMTPHHDFVCVG